VNSMLLAHFADTHVGVKLYGFEWSLEAVLEHFRNAVERALEERVNAIVFSGDLFDKPHPPNKALKAVIETVHRAVERGVRVYSVLGEHDLPKVADIPPQYLIPGLRTPVREEGLIDCFTVSGVEYCIAGVNHIPLKYSRELKRKLLGLIESTSSKAGWRGVLALHQNIVNFMKFEPGLELSEIPGKPMYIAMGHIHRRITYTRENGQVVAYPGSLEIVRRDEVEEWKQNGKGFYLVDLSGDTARVEKVDVEVIPQEVVEADVQSLDKSVAQAAAKLPRDKRSILHVIAILKPSEKVDVAGLVKSVVSRFSQNISVRIEKRYVEETGGEVSVAESVSEVDAIAEVLGGSQYRDLAEKIYMLKQAVLEGDETAVDRLIDEITKHSYWTTRVKPPVIMLPQTVKQSGSKPVSGKGLLSYLQR